MWFDKHWYTNNLTFVTAILLPFSFLFSVLVNLRVWLYAHNLLRKYSFSVPIIVIGNITVGGTGKTPFTIWLVNELKQQGYSPGVVSRGFGTKKITTSYLVQSNDTPAKVGDEALLVHKHTACPVAVGVNKISSVKILIAQCCDIIICDDGLQHYKLVRDLEIAIVDNARQLGNGYFLPAGPLRENKLRLRQCDFIIYNGGTGESAMQLTPTNFIPLLDPTKFIAVMHFPYTRVHAVAGIGNPERFFDSLKIAGLDVTPHHFPDHYHYRPEDIKFSDELPIIMTEKDAIKCYAFANKQHWYLSINANISTELKNNIITRIAKLKVPSNEHPLTKPTIDPAQLS